LWVYELSAFGQPTARPSELWLLCLEDELFANRLGQAVEQATVLGKDLALLAKHPEYCRHPFFENSRRVTMTYSIGAPWSLVRLFGTLIPALFRATDIARS
jgi:hypothetical protein